MALMYCRECGDRVSSEAPTCPHCGVPQPVFINGVPAVALAPAASGAPAPVYVVNAPSHSPGLAAVLSFFLPGLGHLYKGSIGAGFMWFLAVVIGYAALILPGIILHICCIVSAGSRS